MAHHYTTGGRPDARDLGSSFSELDAALSNLEDTALLQRLEAYRLVGRKGYPLRALWRAYLYLQMRNLSSTNHLLRELWDRPELRIWCGFGFKLPHRTTFNRFYERLSRHTSLLNGLLAALTTAMRKLLPDLGQQVAVDATAVRTHSKGQPEPEKRSDQQARWGYKNSAQSYGGKEVLQFGYKLHMVADANYGIPLGQFVTPANANENPLLPRYIEHARSLLSWFKPRVVIADRGYDAMNNHEWLLSNGITPVIHIRRASKGGLVDGVYTYDGVPTCIGQVPMTYVRSDPAKGWLYRCAGCRLTKKRGGRYCKDEVWEDPRRNPRLFGAIPRRSKQWKELYDKRQAVERLFKSMKESLRLERHYIRGYRKVSLHVLLSTLVYQVKALRNAQDGDIAGMRWMVRKVA